MEISVDKLWAVSLACGPDISRGPRGPKRRRLRMPVSFGVGPEKRIGRRGQSVVDDKSYRPLDAKEPHACGTA